MGNYVYIVECSDGTWYTGWTNDLEHRMQAHNSGQGAKYTRSRRPVRLIYFEEHESASSARRREYAIKRLTRAQKEKLVERKEDTAMNVEQFFDKVLTVRLTPDRKALDIIDQTLLPGTIRRISLETKEEIWEAIKKLRVRGAPAIGVSAAYGMAVLSSRIEAQDFETLPIGILTHCNAGTLATAKYGTATAPMYIALEHGWAGSDMHVYCDETRPLLQGARLTSFELNSAGITTTVQCDNMASLLMKSGKIDIIFVGCDRVAANGDAANKIGTSGVAILAKHYGIPFYVCAPSSTIDRNTPTGEQIPIEMRDPDEVTQMWYKERMAPQGINVFNPAFDVTDHSLITGMITEKGLCTDPFDKDFDKYGI